MRRRQDAFETDHHFLFHSVLIGPLFSKSQHVLFRLREETALLEVSQFLDLCSAQTGLLTEGLVVVQSVMTIEKLGHLEVSQLSNLGVQVGANRLPHRHD